jgi:hypothetical protein
MNEPPWDEIDPEMWPLLRALNCIPGIATTGCCIGHDEPDEHYEPDEDGLAFMRPHAYVSLRFTSLEGQEALCAALAAQEFDLPPALYVQTWAGRWTFMLEWRADTLRERIAIMDAITAALWPLTSSQLGG